MTNTLKSRLNRIEQALGERPSRIIVLSVPFEKRMTDEEMDEFLEGQGVAKPAEDDLLVVLLSWTKDAPGVVSVSEKRT